MRREVAGQHHRLPTHKATSKLVAVEQETRTRTGPVSLCCRCLFGKTTILSFPLFLLSSVFRLSRKRVVAPGKVGPVFSTYLNYLGHFRKMFLFSKAFAKAGNCPVGSTGRADRSDAIASFEMCLGVSERAKRATCRLRATEKRSPKPRPARSQDRVSVASTLHLTRFTLQLHDAVMRHKVRPESQISVADFGREALFK